VKFALLLIIVITFLNCTNKGSHSLLDDKLLTHDRELKRIKDTLDLDTINYSHFDIIYTSRPDTFREIPEYFIDTFSQDGNKFRLIYGRSNTQIYSILEKRINENWYSMIEFDKFNGSGRIIRISDVNNDGFKDILRESKFNNEIYLYNPSTQNFIDTICGELNDDVILLDSINNIYCDFKKEDKIVIIFFLRFIHLKISQSIIYIT